MLPETCLCCCHGSTPPPPSGYGTEWKRCCAAPCCGQPATTTPRSKVDFQVFIFLTAQTSDLILFYVVAQKLIRCSCVNNYKISDLNVALESGMWQWPECDSEDGQPTCSSCLVILPLAHFKIDNKGVTGRKLESDKTYSTRTHMCIPCCPVACWGCARRWAWRRWPWPFGTERSGSFCAHGLRLEESHCT